MNALSPTLSRRVKPANAARCEELPSEWFGDVDAMDASLGEQPQSPHQELATFASWVDAPLWVPPKDCSKELAETMLNRSSLLTSRNDRWQAVLETHRDEFTQVREIELARASIRLPKGRLFVTVTEQKNFDRITDDVPASVQTRLDEFLAGPGKAPGVKVYYLKPLCVEVDDELIFTSRDEIVTAMEAIRDEVERFFRRQYVPRLVAKATKRAVAIATAVPRGIAHYAMERRKRALRAYESKLEFQRRRTALDAQRLHLQCRTYGCSFDDMLALTNPLESADVIEQYSLERKLSQAERRRLLQLAAGQLPWFVTLSMTLYSAASIALAWTSPVAVCDPAFVAEVPGSNGVLLKIGHFDDVAGVRHIEL